MMTTTSDDQIELRPRLMRPASERKSLMSAFRGCVNDMIGLKDDKRMQTYDELYAWSCENTEKFWECVWTFCEIKASTPYSQVLEQVPMDKIPKWFLGAKLNYAENMLQWNDDGIAIIEANENETGRRITYRELSEMVRVYASSLRSIGVSTNDAVAAYIPNCADAIAIMLAVASIGAIWTSASPDLGTTGVLERFAQISPKVLISVNAVLYNGKTHDHLAKLKTVAEGLPSLECTIVIPFVSSRSMDIASIPHAESLAAFSARSNPDEVLTFAQLPFGHPLFVLYSSGTTGKPKCIVHSAGGTLLQHKKEHLIHGGLTRSDVFFYYTTTSWMMWQWLAGGLSVGCTLVVYDGSPFRPTPSRLWDLADEVGITIFGTSAKYLQGLQEANVAPRTTHKLSTIRHIYSTGSPLHPEQFDYIYDKIKTDVLVGSITGGTDIVSLFAGHNCEGPVYRGEIMSRCLGMAIDAWSDDGKPLPPGTAGDLVCTKPFPCMPVFFFNDPDGSKYHAAYFEKFEGVWYHGDYVVFNPNTGGVVMLGRSDGTLKPGGVRFGSAELYTVVAKFPQVRDCLAVGQKWKGDERVIMFLRIADGCEFNDELVKAVKDRIRNELSPRHVPAIVLPITDIPYTQTGKKVEVAVRKVIHGETVHNTNALANPESLGLFKDIPELSC